MTRVFVGIQAPESLRAMIGEWRQKHDELPVNWLKERNLHLTLVPPWDASDVAAEARKLRGITSAAFTLDFHTISFGSEPLRPRLIWLLGHMSPALDELKSRCDKAFAGSGDRPLLPHVTMARFDEAEFASFPVRTLNEAVAWQAIARDVTLFETSGHWEYEPLATVPFAA